MDYEIKFKCKNCNADIAPTDDKCSNCGEKITDVGRLVVVDLSEVMRVQNDLEIKKIERATSRMR